ncbi:MAG: S1/P1 nuclease [Bacteroidetes bacterium]|nr:S1/P1 nuclease [Bacteroidota bacterium]
MKTILAFCFCTATSITLCFGWGATGHRAVALIAEKHLTAKAKKNIEKILNKHSLAEVSAWMDEIRSDSAYNQTADWHWVTIETGKTYEQSPKNPHGDVIESINRIVSALKLHTLDARKETEYLKMLIHLVGDIHQPLHVGCCDDQGGNKVKVKWFRSESNLHRVWDSDMIDGSKLSFTELAGFTTEPSLVTITAWQKNTVYDWANESIALRARVYAIGDGNLGYSYNYKNFNVVQEQISRAGIRLAGLLNQIYGK